MSTRLCRRRMHSDSTPRLHSANARGDPTQCRVAIKYRLLQELVSDVAFTVSEQWCGVCETRQQMLLRCSEWTLDTLQGDRTWRQAIDCRLLCLVWLRAPLCLGFPLEMISFSLRSIECLGRTGGALVLIQNLVVRPFSWPPKVHSDGGQIVLTPSVVSFLHDFTYSSIRVLRIKMQHAGQIFGAHHTCNAITYHQERPVLSVQHYCMDLWRWEHQAAGSLELPIPERS